LFTHFVCIFDNLPNVCTKLVLAIYNSPSVFFKNKHAAGIIIPKLLEKSIKRNAESDFLFHQIDCQHRFSHIIFAIIIAKNIKIARNIKILRKFQP
jgi:hypothetical protein